VIIYLDESGDLGFDFVKTHTSKKFVITLLVCDDKMTVDGFRKAIRRTMKNKLNQRKSGRRVVAELKGSNTTRKIKEPIAKVLLRHSGESRNPVFSARSGPRLSPG
jgi:hypothetical protein